MLSETLTKVSHAGVVGTVMATGAVAPGRLVPFPDAGLDASICCKRRLGCSTFSGLNLGKKDEREEESTAAD